MPGQRRDVHDVALLALDHARKERLQGPEVGKDVDVESFYDLGWKNENNFFSLEADVHFVKLNLILQSATRAGLELGTLKYILVCQLWTRPFLHLKQCKLFSQRIAA